VVHRSSFVRAPLIADVIKTIEQPLAAKNSNKVAVQCDPGIGTMQADQRLLCHLNTSENELRN
jgi:hypothetical protein